MKKKIKIRANSSSLIKQLADEKNQVLEHFRNGGTISQLEEKGFHFSKPL
jgi:hypothetical protein